MEISLNCHLICVHVPGTTMILQGTDGLSRGLSLSQFNLRPTDLYDRLFRPLPPCPKIAQWALSLTTSSAKRVEDWGFVKDLDDWETKLSTHSRLIWFPTAQTCRQAMTAASLNWSEHPLTHEHIFVVPRLCQRSFGRVNRHISFIGQYLDVPHLPFVPLTHTLVFHLPPFVRTLGADPDVDSPTPCPRPRWVSNQAILMHGMS